jgi:hypothetical protein
VDSRVNVTVSSIATSEVLVNWAFTIAAASCPRALFNDMDRFVVSFVCVFTVRFIIIDGRSYEGNLLRVSILNPDHFAVPWSHNPRINTIELVYRSLSSHDWLTAVNDDGSNVAFPYAVYSV